MKRVWMRNKDAQLCTSWYDGFLGFDIIDDGSGFTYFGEPQDFSDLGPL